MRGRIRIGTSNITLPGSKSTFPEAYQLKSRLHYYGSLFNTLEVNSCFYKIPLATTYEKWSHDVPDDFHFSLKLTRDATHVKELLGDPGRITDFMNAATGIGNNKGCILVQFPGKITLKYFNQVEQILQQLKTHDSLNQWRIAVEFRNNSWYTGEAYELLEEHKATIVLQDHPKARLWEQPMDSSFVYMRFHGPKGDYRESYSQQFLQQRAGQIKGFLNEGKDVYAYFNNTIGDAFNNALNLKSFCPDYSKLTGMSFESKNTYMKVATYNVNGVNGRLPVLLKWLKEAKPDIVCLQELKAPFEKFPEAAIRDAGYKAIWHGQKSWNGVAILSKKSELKEIRRALPGDPEDLHSRYIEANVGDIIIGCLYLPNGNPYPGPKFEYKLEWFKRLTTHAKKLFKLDVPVMLVGDFNVMPTELDVYKPEKWVNDALFRKEVREAFKRLSAQGWTDAIRKLHPNDIIYTFWDYFRNAYQRNAGLRIDHFLLSPHLAKRLRSCGVDKHVRGWEKTSDHAPVWIELKSK